MSIYVNKLESENKELKTRCIIALNDNQTLAKEVAQTSDSYTQIKKKLKKSTKLIEHLHYAEESMKKKLYHMYQLKNSALTHLDRLEKHFINRIKMNGLYESLSKSSKKISNKDSTSEDGTSDIDASDCGNYCGENDNDENYCGENDNEENDNGGDDNGRDDNGGDDNGGDDNDKNDETPYSNNTNLSNTRIYSTIYDDKKSDIEESDIEEGEIREDGSSRSKRRKLVIRLPGKHSDL